MKDVGNLQKIKSEILGDHLKFEIYRKGGSEGGGRTAASGSSIFFPPPTEA